MDVTLDKAVRDEVVEFTSNDETIVVNMDWGAWVAMGSPYSIEFPDA